MLYRSSLAGLLLASLAVAQAPSFAISFGVRETGAGGASFTALGDDGPGGGSIEWINFNGQTLTADGQVSDYFWFPGTDSATGFTGDGVIDGSFGIFENLRVSNVNGVTEPIVIYIHEFEVIDAPTGPSGGASFLEDFESYMPGDEVLLQEASFSGSTSGSVVVPNPAPSAIIDAFGDQIASVGLQFIDNTTTRWCRLTTFPGGGMQRSRPIVSLADGATIRLRLSAITQSAVVSDGCTNTGVVSIDAPDPVLYQDWTVSLVGSLGDASILIASLPTAETPLGSLGAPGNSACVDLVDTLLTQVFVMDPAPAFTLNIDPLLLAVGLDTIRFQFFDFDTSLFDAVKAPLPLQATDSVQLIGGF